MEVTHREDKVTHAVITAHRAMDVMVSDDATFLHTLTATLYSDQKGAVVREILCNAWDAHKAAGRTHLPVIVTLTYESMIFQDNGLGIPPGVEMQKIYGTFGGSTKRNDGKQTGGFGLGSKAPWAYADQFTVTSSHKGTRTIYNMSKSSAEVGGKPSIIPITSFPTTEEGVIVSVPINGADFGSFQTLIKKFALHGDMNVVLNNAKLPTIPFNSVAEKYVVTPDLMGLPYNEKIFVRYGDVIYPLGSKHEMFASAYDSALDLLHKIGANWKLILLAEPNTISVTPSRESLSMQTHTATAVKSLLENFLYKIKYSPEAKKLSADILVKNINELGVKEKIPGLLAMHKTVPGMDNIGTLIEQKKIIHEPDLITKVVLKRSYPGNKDFRILDIETRLKNLIDQNIANKGLIKTFMNEWEKNKTLGNEVTQMLEWFQKRVVGQVRRKINKSQFMKESRLYVIGHSSEFCHSTKLSINDRAVLAKDIAGEFLDAYEYIPYLRNIVLMSYTKNDALDTMLRKKEITEKYGRFSKVLLYVVPRSPKAVDEARKLLGSMNAVFVDFTVGIDIGRKKAATDNSKPKVKRAAGYPLLSEAYDVTQRPVFSMSRLLDKNVKRSVSPEFYLHSYASWFREKDGQICRGSWMRNYGANLLPLFGSKGVLVTTELQKNKLIAKGIPPMEEYVLKKVVEEITTNPIYKAYAANNHVLQEDDLPHETYTDLGKLLRHKSIKQHFDVYVQLTDEQQSYIAFANRIIDYYRETSSSGVEMVAVLHKTEPSKALKKLVEAVRKSTMIHWVDVSEVASTIAGKDPQKALVALSLLKYALKS